MGRMARPGTRHAQVVGPRRAGSAGMAAGLAAVFAAVLATGLLVACTAEESHPPPDAAPENAALEVNTIPASRLDEKTRNRLEAEVSDVLAGYVVGGFLGDYPRSDFVRGLADFSSGVARSAGADIDLLTAARFADAAAVRATHLVVDLSFLVPDDREVGASAYVDFAFDVEHPDGSTQPITLTGRFALGVVDGEWSFITYDIVRDDGNGLPTEAVS